MDRIISLSALEGKMKAKPQGQRIYQFFEGSFKKLDRKQIREIRNIILKEHTKTIAFLDHALEVTKVNSK